MVHIPRKRIKSMYFHSCPSPLLRIPARIVCFCFPQDERGGENYDLLYQNLIRKYEDDLEH